MSKVITYDEVLALTNTQCELDFSNQNIEYSLESGHVNDDLSIDDIIHDMDFYNDDTHFDFHGFDE